MAPARAEFMRFRRFTLTAAAVIATAVAATRSLALVSLEDGKDHVYVDGSLEMGYDSNVFTNSKSGGSFSYLTTLSSEFTRRAGWIGVNVTAEVDWMTFASLHNQDYVDPKLTAELTKQSGRTTGSLTASIQKSDHADVDVNTRDTSWIYDVGLNFQYPVIERYSISGTFDVNHVNYQDLNLFTNLTAYSSNLYLYYILTEQRDLFIDYGTRLTELANGEHDLDNSLKAGVSGRVIGPFNGSLQAGYSQRTPYGGPDTGSFGDFTANGSMTWNMNRHVSLTANITKDFSTTATAQSVDATSGGLTLQDSFSSKSVATLAGTLGENRFLGVAGLQAPHDTPRLDQFASIAAFYSYTYNEHLKVQLGYSYYRSWSNVLFADFPREQYHITLLSHW